MFGGRGTRAGLTVLGIGCIVLVCLLLGAFGSSAASWQRGPTPMHPTWTTQQLPVPGQPFGAFAGVSCTSANWCVGVGSVPDSVYPGATQHPLAEHWNGAQWLAEPLPDAAATGHTRLAAVSCASTQMCVAVGSRDGGGAALVERWSGSSWAAMAAPAGAGLSGISCASARSCVAVGGRTLARWNGEQWSTHLVSVGITLSAVSCSSPRSCVAVGARGQSTLAVSISGARSTLMRTPNPMAVVSRAPDVSTLSAQAGSIAPGIPHLAKVSYNDDALSGVWCASATRCLAVGPAYSACRNLQSSCTDLLGEGTRSALALSWNGLRWSAVSDPNFGNSIEEDLPSAVSCSAWNACMVVLGAHATRWNGTTWKPVTGLVTPALVAVACPAADACEAVGSVTRDVPRVVLTVASRWRGGGLIRDATSTTLDRPGTVELSAVSCASPSDCMVVGAYGGGDGPEGFQAMAEHWNGSSWAFERVAGEGLNAVSCPATGECFAVGGGCPSCNGYALISRWNGHSWRTQRAPGSIAETPTILYAVSCSGVSACFAVGQVGDRPVIDRWDGSRWTLMHAPAPTITFNGGRGLNAVSCASPAFCIATGPGNAEAELWNGTRWSLMSKWDAQAAPGDVSCPSAAACLTVGFGLRNAQENASTWASAWNGNTWKLAPPPLPAPHMGNTPSQLTGVSCASVSACLAVNGPPWEWEAQLDPSAAFWNGGSWTPVALPQVAGVSTGFHSVACPSPRRCLAIGSTLGRQGDYTVAVAPIAAWFR